MALFDNLLAPKPILDPNQFQQPAGFGTVTATPSSTPVNPFTALIAKLFAQPAGSATHTGTGTDFGSLIAALRTVPHYGVGGNLIAPGAQSSLTPEADWRKMFPTRPTGY